MLLLLFTQELEEQIACDWADMLYRMYSSGCNEKKYKISEMDFMPGDSVGIKSITFLVEGRNAYGYMKK